MPRCKTMGKATGKPALQLLFSEALCQQKHSSAEDPPSLCCPNKADDTQGATMDHILQEISAVSRKLEGMDNTMVALMAETRSMCLDITGFQSQISGLDQRVATVETQVASWTDRDLELLHLRSKLTDLEDRGRLNNNHLLGFPEGVEGADIFSYLRDILPKLTDITVDPLWNSRGRTDWAPRDRREMAARSNYRLYAMTFAAPPTATDGSNTRAAPIG
ncbi:hypothetical protein NDU88_007471 [Pleurodeles waltl]|uniref:Uncharacterized protein n=1 Tax=Pleurodeles waltl TaxID=8319 RepID=A0AAV7P295_PLEWA|nr:hypothetical protein NDU88_007471 [Pleurodeles waltl]